MKRLHLLVLTLTMLFVLPLPTHAAPTPPATRTPINWNDWDVIPGRALIKYRSTRSNSLKQGITAPGIAGLRLTPLEASVKKAVTALSPATPFKSILPDT